MTKCAGCGSEMQCMIPERMGYVSPNIFGMAKMCERCFRLQNYNQFQYIDIDSITNYGDSTKKENGEEKSIATVLGKTISDVFSNLELSSTLTMNFKHISSFVLHFQKH